MCSILLYMKTKTILHILFTISLLTPIANLRAVEVSTTTPVGPRAEIRKEMREEIKEIRKDGKESRMEVRKEVKEKVQEKKAEMKDAMKDVRAKKLDAKAKTRIDARSKAIQEGLSHRIEKLTKVDTEITARIAKKAVTPEITALHTAAKADLAQAVLDVASVKTKVATELNATTSKDIFRGVVKTAEESIKKASASYRKVSEELKKLHKMETASTTITR